MIVNTSVPRWALDFKKPARYKGIYGGRGSGKSHERAEDLIKKMVKEPNESAVCLREIQKSIDMSVKKLLDDKIAKLGVGHYFDSQRGIIKSNYGKGCVIFNGMQDHTADSFKSLEGFRWLWFEEAQNASDKSLRIIRPTMRREDSEMSFTWNPHLPTDAIDQFFRGEVAPPDSILKRVNWSDNPWFPKVLEMERAFDKEHNTKFYDHVWEGEYLIIGTGIIDPSKFVIESMPLQDAQCVRSWDLAFSDSKQSDHFAGALCAQGPEPSNNFQIQDIKSGKKHWPDLKKLIIEVAESDGPDVAVLIESNGTQKGYADDLSRERRMKYFNVVSQSPEGNKIVRASRWASRIERGQVSCLLGQWNQEFFNESRMFTNDLKKNKKDDQVDAVSGAWQYFAQEGGSHIY